MSNLFKCWLARTFLVEIKVFQLHRTRQRKSGMQDWNIQEYLTVLPAFNIQLSFLNRLENEKLQLLMRKKYKM